MSTKSITPNQPEGYLHSHIWFIISSVAVVMAALVIGFFLLQSKLLTNEVTEATDQTSTITTTAIETDAPLTVSASPVEISTDASATTITNEINQIDVAAIQADLEELQATLASFSSLTE